MPLPRKPTVVCSHVCFHCQCCSEQLMAFWNVGCGEDSSDKTETISTALGFFFLSFFPFSPSNPLRLEQAPISQKSRQSCCQRHHHSIDGSRAKGQRQQRHGVAQGSRKGVRQKRLSPDHKKIKALNPQAVANVVARMQTVNRTNNFGKQINVHKKVAKWDAKVLVIDRGHLPGVFLVESRNRSVCIYLFPSTRGADGTNTQSPTYSRVFRVLNTRRRAQKLPKKINKQINLEHSCWNGEIKSQVAC